MVRRGAGRPSRRQWLDTGLVVASSLASVLVSAAAEPTARAAAPAGTLDRLVADFDSRVARSLEGRSPERCDLALVVRGDAGVAPALVAVVRRLIAGKLASKGLRSKAVWAAAPPQQVERRARDGGIELLLDVTLALVAGHLHLRGELKATDRLLWRDMHDPERGALSHLHASVRVDAEVRAYQGPLRAASGALSEQRVPFGWGPVVALGVGDLDGDGRQELVALYPTGVDVLRPRAGAPGGLVRLASWRMQPPLARRWSRRPLGVLHVVDVDGDGRPEVIARSDRYAEGVTLRFDGKDLGPAAGRTESSALVSASQPATARGAGFVLALRRTPTGALERIVGRPESGMDRFAATGLQREPAPPGWQAEKLLPPLFYRLQLASIARPDGRRAEFGAVVDTAGRLSLYDGELQQQLTAIDGVGLAFDLLDLDDDGELDVVTTDACDPDAEDAIAVFRLTRRGLRLRWRSNRLGGRVVAVTHGDLDGNGKQEVIAAMVDASRSFHLLVFQ